MLIVNPLYDNAFKYLMENNRLARKILSVILEEEIEELIVGQQETFVPYATFKISLFRLDFKATIRQSDGTRKTVLIELQKSKIPTDIQRFRNYLGASYMSQNPETDPQELPQVQEPIPGMLPIITIYILGYNLEDLPYLAVSVNKEVINAVNKQRVEVKSNFIDHLTHQAHIIQVRRLPEVRRTRLEKFLTLFNQAWCTQHNYILDLQDVPEEFSDVADYLQLPARDEAFRIQMQGEKEIEDIFEIQAAGHLKEMQQIRQQLEESKKQMLSAKKEAERERREAEKERREAEKEKEILLRKYIRSLLHQGLSPEEIARETGLNIEKITEFQ